ncbi:MAG: hypothetical protein LAO04_13005 [Acidobacteriia bacterium]|nr:hypothetical protein [Terriglobia bacterium]
MHQATFQTAFLLPTVNAGVPLHYLRKMLLARAPSPVPLLALPAPLPFNQHPPPVAAVTLRIGLKLIVPGQMLGRQRGREVLPNRPAILVPDPP